MDLFTPQVDPERQHIYFRELTSGRNQEKMALLASWAQRMEDRDGKFVKEFQTTFDASFWELYLHEVFWCLCKTVDATHARPDFLLELPSGQKVAAEATIASNASGYVPQWQPDFVTIPPVEAMREYQSIRLANALSGKFAKYQNEYSKLPHVADKPFVVCVAPFEQQWSNSLGDRAMRRVLFAVDVPFVDTDETGTSRIVGHADAERAWKPSGAEIPFGLFRDERWADVSAVLFGPLATWGKLSALNGSSALATLVQALRYDPDSARPFLYRGPLSGYRETLTDGLHLFVNPFARRPLDVSWFRKCGLAVHAFVPQQDSILHMVPPGFLISRTIFSLHPKGSGPVAPSPGADLRRPECLPFPEDVLHRVGGRVGLTVDTHLAHHRDWTILVARDTVDGDWGAMARPGLFREIDSFRSANEADDSKTLLCFDWHPTKEQALAAMIVLVDEATSG